MKNRFIWGLTALFLFIPTLKAETLSSLITEARVLSFDAQSSRQRFTDAQVTVFINQGQRKAIDASRCLQTSQSFLLATGTTYYALPSNYLSMERVTIGGLWMTQMSPAALDARSRGWETASGRPTYYFINFSSRSYVGFAPFPQTVADTDTIKMEYSISATDLSATTDIPYNSVSELTQYQHALAYYAASKMLTIQGLGSQAGAYEKEFNEVVAMMWKACRANPNYMPSAAASP